MAGPSLLPITLSRDSSSGSPSPNTPSSTSSDFPSQCFHPLITAQKGDTRKRKRMLQDTAAVNDPVAMMAQDPPLLTHGASSLKRGERVKKKACRADPPTSGRIQGGPPVHQSIPTAEEATEAQDTTPVTTILRRQKGKQVLTETASFDSLEAELNPVPRGLLMPASHSRLGQHANLPPGHASHAHNVDDIPSLFTSLEHLLVRMRNEYAGTMTTLESSLKTRLKADYDAAVERLEEEQQAGLNYSLAESFQLRDTNFVLATSVSEKDAIIIDLEKQRDDARASLNKAQKQRDAEKSLSEAAKRSLLETDLRTAQRQSLLETKIINLKADLIAMASSHKAELARVTDEASSNIRKYQAALLRYSRTGAFLKGVVDSLRHLPWDPRSPPVLASEDFEIKTLMTYYSSRVAASHAATRAVVEGQEPGDGTGPSGANEAGFTKKTPSTP